MGYPRQVCWRSDRADESSKLRLDLAAEIRSNLDGAIYLMAGLLPGRNTSSQMRGVRPFARFYCFTGGAGSILPMHDPKPLETWPRRLQRRRKVISSPSCRKPRFSPVASVTGLVPALVNYSMLLSSAGVGPEIVPVPM